MVLEVDHCSCTAMIFFLVDQHFIAPIQIRERHPRLHHTSAASGDFLFIQWPPTYFSLEPWAIAASRAWGGASTPKPGPLRDRRDPNPDGQRRLRCCYQLRHSGPCVAQYTRPKYRGFGGAEWSLTDCFED